MRASRSIVILALVALSGFISGAFVRSVQSRRPASSLAADKARSASTEMPDSSASPSARTVRKIEAQVDALLTRARAGESGQAAATDLQRAVNRWLLADPLSCILWLHNRGATGLVDRKLFPDAFRSALKGDLILAIRVGGEIPDPLLRSAWIRSAFENASDADPAKALELSRFLPAKMQAGIVKDLISAWAAKDGANAWRAVIEGNRSDSEALAAAALGAWCKSQPSAAEEFVRSKLIDLRRGKEKDLFLAALRNLALQDHGGIVLRAMAGPPHDALLRGIWMDALGSAEDGDVSRVRLMIEQEPPGLKRDVARASFARALIESNVNLAVEVANTLPSHASRREVIGAAITNLIEVKDRPQEAAIIAQSYEEPMLRTEHIQKVTSLWGRKAPAALLQFVLAQSQELAAEWLDQIASRTPADFPTDALHNHDLTPAEQSRLQRELDARLPEEEAARLFERFVGR